MCGLQIAMLLGCLGAAPYALKAAQPSSGLSALERRGKTIYFTGTGADAVRTYLGESEVPAGTLPCAGCHGEEGEGRPEGGVVPSVIRWSVLTKPYAVRLESGRHRAPYTTPSLAAAISRGIDSSGRALPQTMPRYEYSPRDMGALLAYMRKLGADPDPGVTPQTLVLGTVLPGGAESGPGDAVLAVLEAAAERLNRAGGLFGRRLLIAPFRLPGAEQRDAIGAASEWLRRTPVFALVAPVTGTADGRWAALFNELQIPVIAPLTEAAPGAAAAGRYVFYLHSGREDRLRALVRYMAVRSARSLIAVVQPAGRPDAAAAILRQSCEQLGCEVEVLDCPPLPEVMSAEIERLRTARPAAVYFGGSQAEFLRYAAACNRAGFVATYLMTESAERHLAAAAKLPAGSLVYVAFSSRQSEVTAAGRAELRALLQTSGVSASYGAAQTAALAAMKVVSEALRRAGRDASREKLIRAIESLYEYQTELAPPLSFGPNRRVGAPGAYIVEVDPARQKYSPMPDRVLP